MSKAREKKVGRRTSTTNESTREEIEQRAYEIYLGRGAMDGHALEDWVQAEHELRENALH